MPLPTVAPRGRLRVQAALPLAAMLLLSSQASAQGVVNIYSYREPALIDPLLKSFKVSTGITPNVVFASAGLNERLAAEGRNSPADLLFTVDASRLTEAKDDGLTTPIASPVLEQIPAPYRDPDGHWLGLSMRARVFYVSRERVKQDAITYEELAEPKWAGKICVRSGQHVYNTAMTAALIAHNGEAATEQWAKGVKANLGRKPAGGDREAVRDVQAGLCDLAIGNTYYMAAMLANPQQKAWADSVRIVFPNVTGRGSHINISGVALTKYAPNKANAVKLIEFLASEQGQKLYAETNNEYPVNPKVKPSALVESWGVLKPDPLPLGNITKFRKSATELMDRVAFDQGPGK